MKNCLCGEPVKNSVLLTDKIRFNKKARILKCNKCSLVYMDQDSVKFPDQFYEKEYHQTYLTHIEPDALDPKKYFEKMKKVTEIWSNKFRKQLTGNETILDVGCSTGHFIKNIESNAKKVFGHELSKTEVDFCKNELNLEIIISRNFASLHDILLYVLLPHSNSGEISYDHPVMEAVTELLKTIPDELSESVGRFGQNNLYVLKRS